MPPYFFLLSQKQAKSFDHLALPKKGGLAIFKFKSVFNIVRIVSIDIKTNFTTQDEFVKFIKRRGEENKKKASSIN